MIRNICWKKLLSRAISAYSDFLMKGMEGDADANKDKQITAGELHAYVQQDVIHQSSGSQTPQLQGDSERAVVRFQ